MEFKPFKVIITQELDALIFKALLSLIKTEQSADSIVQASAVISYFNQSRLEADKELFNEKKEKKEEFKEKVKKT